MSRLEEAIQAARDAAQKFKKAEFDKVFGDYAEQQEAIKKEMLTSPEKKHMEANLRAREVKKHIFLGEVAYIASHRSSLHSQLEDCDGEEHVRGDAFGAVNGGFDFIRGAIQHLDDRETFLRGKYAEEYAMSVRVYESLARDYEEELEGRMIDLLESTGGDCDGGKYWVVPEELQPEMDRVAQAAFNSVLDEDAYRTVRT